MGVAVNTEGESVQVTITQVHGCLVANLQTDLGQEVLDALARSLLSRIGQTGARGVASNVEVVAATQTLVLAVKPAQVEGVLKEIRANFTPDHVLISIAAGVTLARLEAALPAGARVIRVMPNTPALVGASATGFAPGKAATAADTQKKKNKKQKKAAIKEAKKSKTKKSKAIIDNNVQSDLMIEANKIVNETTTVKTKRNKKHEILEI